MIKYIGAHMDIQYEGETDEQFDARVRHMKAFNAAANAELAKWRPAPMRGLEDWCRKHAPELLEPGGLERMRVRR